jgi:hypothetical protein
MKSHKPEQPPAPPDHLSKAAWRTGSLRFLFPVGFLALVVAGVLTFTAPNALWFLLYPVLIIGALYALTTVAAWLIRHF